MQVALKYLLHCQRDLSTRLEEQTSHFQSLKEKYVHLTTSHRHMLSRYEDAKSELESLKVVLSDLRQPYSTCPICQRKFKNNEYLDRHFRTKHPEFDPHWRAIRGKACVEVPGTDLKELITQIQELRNATIKKPNLLNIFPKATSNPFAPRPVVPVEEVDIVPDAREVKRQARSFVKQHRRKEAEPRNDNVSDAASRHEVESPCADAFLLSERSEIESPMSNSPANRQAEPVLQLEHVTGPVDIGSESRTPLQESQTDGLPEPSARCPMSDSSASGAGRVFVSDESIEREIDEIENGSTEDALNEVENDETDDPVSRYGGESNGAACYGDGYSCNSAQRDYESDSCGSYHPRIRPGVGIGDRLETVATKRETGITHAQFDALFAGLDSMSS
jgi:hypothetical protein